MAITIFGFSSFENNYPVSEPDLIIRVGSEVPSLEFILVHVKSVLTVYVPAAKFPLPVFVIVMPTSKSVVPDVSA